MRVGGTKGFWDVIKKVSVAEIAKEANRPLSMAIVGTPEQRSEAIKALCLEQALPDATYIEGFEAMTEEAGFPRQPAVFDFVIDMGTGRSGAPEGVLIYAVEELGGWESTLERILDDRGELALPLARNFPAFRRPVSQRIIAQTATANAQFALITGITAAVPLLGFLLPVNGLSDILILTKNQSMMALRLAAASGLSVDPKKRMKELAPILGNAFGWRAIARELVGIVPGVGFLIKAMIAYAGTVTVGKAVQIYYETGEQVTTAQLRRFYQEAYIASKDKVRAIADSLRGGKGGGGGGSKLRNEIAAISNGATTPEADSLPEDEIIETELVALLDEEAQTLAPEIEEMAREPKS